MVRHRKPELLAPAGGPEAFHAAVNNGADAVYCGLEDLNARRQAENLTLVELAEAVRYAHLRDVRVYLAANTLVKERELRAAFNLVEKALAAGVDGFIVQDLGFARLLLRAFDGIRLHASTQVNCHNTATARLLAEAGFRRVVLARETPLPAIERLKGEVDIEVEIFAHGALCFSYSGQCLLSSLIGGRSGNRGLCAQPCRLAYDLVEQDVAGGAGTPVVLPYRHLLSTRDLNTIALLPRILAAGVDSLKIEGRLKSAEYVALVTAVYRRELDRAWAEGKGYAPLRESLEQLEEAFSRGFTAAYLVGSAGNEMMSYARPNNRGAFVGRVTFVDHYTGRVGFLPRRAIARGDILEFWVSRGGRVVQRVDRLYAGGVEVEAAPAGARAEVVVDEKRHLIAPGDRVHRVYSRALDTAASVSFQRESSPVPMAVRVRVREGLPLAAVAEADGVTVTVETGAVPEAALERPTTAEQVAAQMGRLGGTAYRLVNCEVEIETGLYVPVRRLNELRRRLVAELDARRLERARPRVVRVRSFAEAYRPASSPPQRTTPVLAVKVPTAKAAEEAFDAGADLVVLAPHVDRDVWARRDSELERVARIASSAGREWGLAVPNVLADEQVELYAALAARTDPPCLLVDQAGAAFALAGLARAVVADYHVNTFNSETARFLKGIGCARATASVELSFDEIVAASRATGFPFEVVVHGDIEVMTSAHCVLRALSPEDEGRACRTRACRRGRYALRDQRGYEFPVLGDAFCRGRLFNSRTLCAPEFVGGLVTAGINHLRLELVLPRRPGEIGGTVRRYRELVDAASAGDHFTVRREELCGPGTTRGHFNRGVA